MKLNRVRNVAIQYGGLLVVLLLLILFFSIGSSSFFQVGTVLLIANQIPDLTLIAVGMTLVLVIGQIDLSVGSVMALCGAVLGILMVNSHWPIWAAIPISLMVGAVCGMITGSISIYFGVPSFIVSLGMLEMARGATRSLLNSKMMTIGSEIEFFNRKIPEIGLSPIFLIALASVLIFQFVLTRTVFGRYCIAIGTNAEAVRMSGIRTKPYAITVFAISGILCGLAALLPTSKYAAADPNAGTFFELQAIAACVIGGTSLMGGRGNVLCTFLGVLIIKVLETGLDRMSVDANNKQIITGAVIIAAVMLDILRQRWKTSRD